VDGVDVRVGIHAAAYQVFSFCTISIIGLFFFRLPRRMFVYRFFYDIYSICIQTAFEIWFYYHTPRWECFK